MILNHVHFKHRTGDLICSLPSQRGNVRAWKISWLIARTGDVTKTMLCKPIVCNGNGNIASVLKEVFSLTHGCTSG